jgi:hypothetical protein
MAKTKYQDAAMKYAEDYLERLLKMEDIVGHNVEKKLSKMVEEKFRELQEDQKKESRTE